MKSVIRVVFFHGLLLILFNFTSNLFAQSVDLEFNEARILFENRDLISISKAMIALEKIIAKNPDHLETQALLSFVYAHQASIARQIGQPSIDYENSASAFSTSVLAVQSNHRMALKTNAFLLLSNGNRIDAKKIIDAQIQPNETDIDWLYMQAVVSEEDKTIPILSAALSLNTSHVWIYFDMAMRSVKSNNLPNADKWLSGLKVKYPHIAEIDLLQIVIAAYKNDRNAVEEHAANFLKKMPSSLISKKIHAAIKRQASGN